MHEQTRAVLAQSPAGELQWVESLTSEGGRPYTLVVDYPRGFPYERPRAFICGVPIDGAPHRLRDGSLCLFDDPWCADPRCSALVVRNRAMAWMLAFELWEATGVWAVPEHGSQGGVP